MEKWKYSSTHTRWRWVVSFAPQPVYLHGKIPSIYRIGGWVCSRGGLDLVANKKNNALPGLEPRSLKLLQDTVRQVMRAELRPSPSAGHSARRWNSPLPPNYNVSASCIHVNFQTPVAWECLSLLSLCDVPPLGYIPRDGIKYFFSSFVILYNL